jgi:hypothetical protein
LGNFIKQNTQQKGKRRNKERVREDPKSKARRRAKAQMGSLRETTKEQIMFPSPPPPVARTY